MLVASCVSNFMIFSEVKSYSLSPSFCGESHAILTTGYWFPLSFFSLALDFLLRLGERSFICGRQLGQLGLLGYSTCETTEGCHSALDTL